MIKDFLAGIRVLDLSLYLPGPFATRTLADMGADVVKVEPPTGDPTKTIDIDVDESWSAFYRMLNAGKRIVTLDLKTESDRDALTAMVAHADVLLESFRPGVLDRLGFGEERLRVLHPNLIHCALSGYGQTGPNALAAGHDLNYQALTGGLGACGIEERPVMPYPPMADYAGATQAVVAILGALVGKERRREGVYLDVSLFESLLAWQGPSLTVPPERGETILNGGAAFYQIYRTADGRFVTLSPIEPKFWANFCNAVGHPDWIARQVEPPPQRALIAEVAALFASQPLAYWEELLPPADCCYQAVLTYPEVIAHPHNRERRLIHERSDFVEVLFPAYADGRPPAPRPEVIETDAASVLASWG